jgi:hypothetical protein
MYDMEVHLGKAKQCEAEDVTATHAKVTELTRKVEGQGDRLFMDNFFSSPDLSDDLTKKLIIAVVV